jgi:hypothetical protein
MQTTESLGGSKQMNNRTAQHLNELLRRTSKPITLELEKAGDYGLRLAGGSDAEISAIYAYIEACRVRVEPQATAEEIRNAAAQHRIADIYTGDTEESLTYWGQVNNHHAHAGGIALRLCIDEIRAEITRLNAAAAEQYEAYRIACEQGVAVPPHDCREEI